MAVSGFNPFFTGFLGSRRCHRVILLHLVLVLRPLGDRESIECEKAVPTKIDTPLTDSVPRARRDGVGFLGGENAPGTAHPTGGPQNMNGTPG